MKSLSRLVAALAVPALLFAACSNDDGAPVAENGTTPGGEAGTGTGEAEPPPEGGSGGSEEPEVPCPHEGAPVLDPSSLQACPSYVCEDGGHCIPNALVPPDVAGFLDICNKDSFCVPDSFIETGGNFLLTTCNAVLGIEGRCLSRCIPQVADQAERLTQDSCGASELCVPCYDPLTLEDTGVCNLTCDVGPSEPAPEPLPTCCPGGNGTCIPHELLPPEALGGLAQDSCPSGDMACVPNQMIDPTWYGAPCAPDPLLQLLGVDDGACLPECVDAVKNIGPGSCPSGYKCAPCDAFGEPTGACAEIW
jgi:hypothetical protein